MVFSERSSRLFRFSNMIFANLGLKIVAIVIAVALYAYTHRPEAQLDDHDRCPPAAPDRAGPRG